MTDEETELQIKKAVFLEMEKKFKPQRFLQLQSLQVKASNKINEKVVYKVLSGLIKSEVNLILFDQTMLDIYVMNLLEKTVNKCTSVEDAKEKINFYMDLDFEMIDSLSEQLKSFLKEERTIMNLEEFCIFVSDLQELHVEYIKRLKNFMTNPKDSSGVWADLMSKLK